MFPDCFYDHYDALHQKIRRHFDLAANYFDIEALHELRVEIKRLRAFFELIEFINPNFRANKNFKNIRKLFKAAGPLRDVHVQQETTRAWSKKLNLNLSEYYNFLKQKEMALRPEFSAAAKQFDFKVFDANADRLRNYLQYLPADFVESKTHSQLDGLLQKARDLKNPPGDAAIDFHQIRITTKAARYTLEVLLGCFQKKELEPLNAKLRELHQALGKWRDAEMAIQSLQAFLQEAQIELFSRESYHTFEQGLQDEKTKQLAAFEMLTFRTPAFIFA
jgi:CHAD domain-containing protein